MTYATQAQLVDRFGEAMLADLTDRSEPRTGEIDPVVVARALADTDALIDGYIAARYRLPLVEVPPMVADLSATIAIYKLHPYAPDPKIKDDYDGAMKTLLAISRGDVRLPVAETEPAGRNDGGVQTSDRDRPFNNQDLSGFI